MLNPRGELSKLSLLRRRTPGFPEFGEAPDDDRAHANALATQRFSEKVCDRRLRKICKRVIGPDLHRGVPAKELPPDCGGLLDNERARVCPLRSNVREQRPRARLAAFIGQSCLVEVGRERESPDSQRDSNLARAELA